MRKPAELKTFQNLSAACLGEQYLLDRGLPLDVAQVNGIEIDLNPERARIEERLGVGCVPLWTFATEVLWFPQYNKERERLSWLARGLPTMGGKPKFVAPTKNSGIPTGIPYIPIWVWHNIGKPVKPVEPLILTEGPMKALVLVQAGALAVGLNGVFGAQETAPDGKLVLRKELVELGVRGRKVFLCFDADASSDLNVRLAEIRLWFLLQAAGAEVFRLTSWNESQGKGIDDYLVNATEEESDRTRESIVQKLLADAQPFKSSLSKNNTIDLDAIVSELEKVAFTTPQRDQLCKELYEPLGVRIGVLRQAGAETESRSRQIIFPTFEPWPDPVDSNALIEDLIDLYRKHVVLDDWSIFTIVLWGLLSFFADSETIDTLPFLTLSSPEKRCGKTRLQSVLEWVVYRALSASNFSDAGVYRTVEAHSPTLLLDEADTFVKDNEELRGILNSGHTRQKAFVIRINLLTMEPERFSVWCPKSFALIGRLPGTLHDRSIVIRMERKKHSQKVSPLRATTPEEREEFQRKIRRWVADNRSQLEALDPATIERLNDRAADNWAPLLQIAKLAGQVSLNNALKAMAALNPQEGDPEPESRDGNLGPAVLTGLRRIFYDFARGPVRDLAEAKARAAGKSEQEIEPAGKDAARSIFPEDDLFIPTSELLDKLNADKEAPWADWHRGKVDGLSAKKLGAILSPYKVKSVQLKRGEPMGYRFGSLRDAFERYLPLAHDYEPVS